MKMKKENMNRRKALRNIGASMAGLLTASQIPKVMANTDNNRVALEALPTFTGPGSKLGWNSMGPLVFYPQKLPLIRLTDRPVQLETPRHYFRSAITPNNAFFVRYHMPSVPTEIDLNIWRLNIEGEVNNPAQLSLEELLNLPPNEVVAVNECSGNSRSFFQPRVPGGQWGHGAMGCARWKGIRLMDLLERAGIKSTSKQIQFQGLDLGKGPKGYGSHAFMKSFSIDDPALQNALIAYSMNSSPLPILNGFPVRMVFPGKFATYWVKHVTWIRVLDHTDTDFWTAKAYKIPATPQADTTPEAIAKHEVDMVSIGTTQLPVRSFIVSPDDQTQLLAGLTNEVCGIAFSGSGKGIASVEFSADDGKTWKKAVLGEDLGPYAFRTWRFDWTPSESGVYKLAVRAKDSDGSIQPDHTIWNPGGYVLNRIERQVVHVGKTA
ncbi:hypothetical protein LCGC14_0655580 [marine sediment metagenome]|uniref:Oxidoreductase molybdopterin-binding domain-containing protein n=1 Tax=marine sediment metagenome TaxID=412755 RepID=A0A0F9TGT5_9ZZZZ